jgi:K+-sensing histidine kinase KdpD
MIKNILNKSLKFRIIFALLMTLVALALTFQLKSHIQDARFLILYPTIFFMAWAPGLSPAMMAVIHNLFYHKYRHSLDDRIQPPPGK